MSKFCDHLTVSMVLEDDLRIKEADQSAFDCDAVLLS